MENPTLSPAIDNLLAREAIDWHQQGLIDRPLLELLLQRYGRRREFLATILKWLGIFAVLQLGLAVLAFIALWSQSAAVATLLLGGVSAAAWHFGVRMATDPHQRYPFSGAVLVSTSLAGLFGTFTLLHTALGGEPDGRAIPTLMVLTSLPATLTAYRYHLRWPLLLALLWFFHGLGAWHRYGGHGAYFADIQEPRLMAIVALAAIGLGIWHERRLEIGPLWRCTGFGGLYLIFGLLYLNVSLWFLTLANGALDWVLVFTAATIGQLIAGARLQDSRITGFGMVFLGINLYTRYYEHFWDQLSVGFFFLLGGALAMLVGYFCERQNFSQHSDKTHASPLP